MKLRPRMRDLAGAFVVALMAMAASPREAAAQTWTGAGANANWSTAANWSGGTVPASAPTTALTFPALVPVHVPIVDVPWTVNRMDFTGNYQLSGQTLTFAGASPALTITGGTLTLTNPIVLSPGLGVQVNGGFIDLLGPITGTGPITVTGNAGLALDGASPGFTGLLNVTGGAATAVNGFISATAIADGFSVLSGSGTITGFVSVHAPNGSLNPGSAGPGILRTGSLASQGFVRITIDGTFRGGQYSGLDVSGSVNLQSTLVFSGSYVPVAGDVFVIISNDGTDPVVGTFTGLPEGATINFNGMPLRVSYVGGDGNDVTLTALGATGGFAVPTLSDYALVLLALAVLAVGAVGMRRS